MQINNWSNDKAEQNKLLARAPLVTKDALLQTVTAILNDVRERGDIALTELTEKLDRVTLKTFRVSEEQLKSAYNGLTEQKREALQKARKNIAAFHKAQMPPPISIETSAGINCQMVWRAINPVGLYVPAGTAPLLSALLMLAVPAVIAGCREIILCTPPQKDGRVNAETMAAAWLCGIKNVYAVGGAQAIAAMAYGTEQIPKVSKILGPGNAYVTLAKQIVSQESGGVAIDMPAGPSEVMVIAGPADKPDWVAADLLAQAEHDAVSQAILVTTSASFAEQVRNQVYVQMESLPRRSIIGKSLEICRAIVVDTEEQALDVANLYAPEHLIIPTENAEWWTDKIQTAASVFLGPYTSETGGDYATGTNHVLPTYGAARAYGGLSVYSFLKSMTVQSVSQEALEALAPTLVTLARAEGLDGHAAAVTIRTGKTYA